VDDPNLTILVEQASGHVAVGVGGGVDDSGVDPLTSLVAPLPSEDLIACSAAVLCL
jgi:hypothetical protein